MNINDYPLDEGGLTIFDHGCRTHEELCADIIELALDCGWPGMPGDPNEPSSRELIDLHWQTDREYIDADCQITVQQALEWDAQEAVEFLNEQLEAEDYYVGDDYGAFGIWPIDME